MLSIKLAGSPFVGERPKPLALRCQEGHVSNFTKVRFVQPLSAPTHIPVTGAVMAPTQHRLAQNNQLRPPTVSHVQPLSSPEMPTPVDPQVLDKFLTGYDPSIKQDIIMGFKYGFRIGFVGQKAGMLEAPNLKTALEMPDIVDRKLA